MTFPDHDAFGSDNTCGLTKREYFAALALQGVLASCVNADPHADTAATMAVEYADALIAALNSTTTPK